MANMSWNSRQFNNSIARSFFLLYDETVARTGSYTQSNDQIFFGFFQNAQAVIDANTWNTWVLNDARSGTAPASTDTYYPEYFNVDTVNWRNKFVYLVPATKIQMVKKDAAGTISYNGQNWSVISSFNEEAVTTGSENRYVYLEADLRYYDSALTVCTGISSKNIITGLGIYKVTLNGATGLPNTFGTGLFSAVDYDSGVSDYEYKIHPTINSKTASTVYDKTYIGSGYLTFLYSDTFQSIVRSTSLHSVFSVIIEF